MSKPRVVIFGVSGHSKVIIDIIERADSFELVGFVDNETSAGTSVLGYDVLGNDSSLPELMVKHKFSRGIIGIGDNYVRSRIASYVDTLNASFEFINCVHPSAEISDHIQIGTGNVVMAGATVSTSAKIANHCVINTNSSLDHDCTMDDYSCLGPNSAVGGNTRIGKFAFVGIGASVFQDLSVGVNCLIGGGSVVIRDTKANSVYFGNPAKFVTERESGDKYL